MSIANEMSSSARTPFSCSQINVDGASITMPGTISVSPSQAKIRRIGPKSHDATASWCQPWSKTIIPRPSSICSNCHRMLRSGSSHPPRPVATIFMCTETGSPISPASMRSRIFTNGGKNR